MSSFRFFCELTGIELVGGVAGESLNRSSMLDVLFAFLCKFSEPMLLVVLLVSC
jgi:hypothetical protein